MPDGIPRKVTLPLGLPDQIKKIDGEPVFWASGNAKEHCIATRDNDGHSQWAIDVVQWLNSCRTLLNREPRKPFYTKVPWLNINYVPYWIRVFLFQYFFNSARNLEPDISLTAGIDCLGAISRTTFKQDTLACFAPPKWPYGKRACLIITMDVNSDYIFKAQRNILLEKLEAMKFKSAWYFLTGRYSLQHAIIEDLASKGHEIGWHGHNHDHRLGFVSTGKLKKRIEKAKPFFEIYAVEGMRVENFLWSRHLLKQISTSIKYDTSLRDSYPTSEEGSGTSTSIPFKSSEGTWALPTSISGDYCLPETWANERKLKLIKEQVELRIATGGVIHLIFHPEPGLTLLLSNIELFDSTLEYLATKRDLLWHCLPKELYAHCLNV